MTQHYFAQQLFDGEQILHDVSFCVAQGKITSINADKKTKHDDAQVLSGLVAPGFIDVQVNGGGGMLFNDTPTLQCLEAMMAAHAQFGTTAMLPTVITDSVMVMRKAADAVSEALDKKLPGIIGIHFEGPHISAEKKGIHNENYIREITAAEKTILARNDLGIKVMTVAPEVVSSEDIEWLVAQNIHVCLGHSNATFAQTQTALQAGATGFTHLFNAMSPLTGREPGMVGAALLDDKSWCGIILDGHHLADDTVRLAMSIKPKSKFMLVTDAMSPVGTEQKSFQLLGEKIFNKNGKLVNAEGCLAGSALTMEQALQYAVKHIGLSLQEALKMTASNVAEFLKGGEQRGCFAEGMQADFVLLNHNNEVVATWIAGTQLV